MSLSAIIPGYTHPDIGFTEQEAVRLVTSDHLRSQVGRGKGSKAKRRMMNLRQRMEARAISDHASPFAFTDQPLTERDYAKMEAWYAARRPARVLVAQDATAEF